MRAAYAIPGNRHLASSRARCSRCCCRHCTLARCNTCWKKQLVVRVGGLPLALLFVPAPDSTWTTASCPRNQNRLYKRCSMWSANGSGCGETRIRFGTDKTAYMCTGGQDPSRNCLVYITTFEGDRMALPAVSVYTYLGLPIQSNLRQTQLIKRIKQIAQQRTWMVVNSAAKQCLHVKNTE